MEQYPADVVLLMDELSTVDFCKLAVYKLNNIKIETLDELIELEKVMCKAIDLSTKMKLCMLSPALREYFYKVLADSGLDKPPSMLADIAKEYFKMPSSAKRESVEENQPMLFENTSKPCDADPPRSARPGLIRMKLEPVSPPPSSNQEQELYEAVKMKLQALPKQYREGSPSLPRAYRSKSSPPKAYRSKSQSRPRERKTRWSRTPSPCKRSSFRPRRSLEGSTNPPPVRYYSRFDARGSRSSSSYSRRSPPSPKTFTSGSQSSSSPSPPTRSSSQKSRSPPSVRKDEQVGARKGRLFFRTAQ